MSTNRYIVTTTPIGGIDRVVCESSTRENDRHFFNGGDGPDDDVNYAHLVKASSPEEAIIMAVQERIHEITDVYEDDNPAPSFVVELRNLKEIEAHLMGVVDR